jgi:hypothetical protein
MPEARRHAHAEWAAQWGCRVILTGTHGRYNIEVKLPVGSAHSIDERILQQLPGASLVQATHAARRAPRRFQ